jgi:hypothetical protein
MVPQKKADDYTLKYVFDVDARRKKYNKPKYKVKSWFKGLFK